MSDNQLRRAPSEPSESSAELAVSAASDVIPVELAAQANVVQGFDDGGLADRAFPSQGAPLLDSFFFQFRLVHGTHGLVARLPRVEEREKNDGPKR